MFRWLQSFCVLALTSCTGNQDSASPPGPARTAEGPTLAYTWEGHGEVSLSGTVRGEGSLAVSVRLDGERFLPTITAGPEGGVFEGAVFTGHWQLTGQDAVFWRQGYQSWSWSGVTELGEPTLADGVPAVAGDGDVETLSAETNATSWWAGLVGERDGESLLIGATSAATTKVYTAFSGSDAWVVYGTRGERITLGPDETLELDPLVITVGADPNTLWEGWADEVAERPPARPPWVGWSDWYQYYGETTEELLLTELSAAVNLDSGLAPLEVFQVDDGWEIAWGEWEANERFPSGTAAFASAIHAEGLTAGLWMAPFYVARSTPTYAAHPDWWVRDAEGAELVHGELSGNNYAILDVTDPEAAAWLQDQIAAKVAEGWTYLKLDFLYAGAVEGVRDTPVTGAQAYRIGMQLLRDAMGPETWFLACGAPMLPTAGYADSWRSGADIAFESDRDPRRPYLRWETRSTAARSFLNGRWWWNDADNLLLRAPFSDTEARGAIAATLASGGMWLLGDGFAALDADRLAPALDPELVALLGRAGTPADPLAYVSGFDAGPFMEAGVPDDEVPRAWTVGAATVLLNLDDGERTVEGPGGTEVLTGETAAAGARVLAAGAGEVWVP